MHNNINPRQPGANNSRVMIGLIIILIGFLAFIKSFNLFFFPNWIFSWPMILIVIGLIVGSRSNFQKPASFVLVFLGVFFLVQSEFNVNVGHFFWPFAIICLGFYLILGNRQKKRKQYRPFNQPFSQRSQEPGLDWDKRVVDESENASETNDFAQDIPFETETDEQRKEENKQSGAYAQFDQEDFIDSVSVFGGVKKIIFSKNFKGGDVVNIMGGTDINLMNADIQGPIAIEIVQLFGGFTIIVPSHWKVYSDMSAVFGGVDDKRMINPSNVDNNKTLYIKGVTLFGGVTIKGF
ncbi:LiaF transmembrane domain-containing protein [Olivibacter sitiensis]|uniref:LiaF transmembrane domain-containing protein n=1 Tax=Olivibacter sitiensis TaxID=376470 RepID=UPI00040DC491|nr:DUF5668 domain-containing protein [Olivibacter sitiensis]